MNCVKGNFQWARKYDHLKQLMKVCYKYFGWDYRITVLNQIDIIQMANLFK